MRVTVENPFFTIGNVVGQSDDHVTRARKNMGEEIRLMAISYVVLSIYSLSWK